MQTIEFRNCLSISHDDRQAIKEYFSIPRKIVIASHKNPDGDALGSAIGLANALNMYGHQASVIIPDTAPASLSWLPGFELVQAFDRHKNRIIDLVKSSDAFFIVDLSHPDRMGDMSVVFDNYSGLSIQIDHHPGVGGFTDYSFISPGFGSTAELILYFLMHIDYADKLNPEISTCLLTGIITDTLGLKVVSSYPEVFQAVMLLMQNGANKDQIYDEVYNQYSESRLRLLGFSLESRMNIYEEQNAACIYLSKEDFKKFDHKKGDTEGFVNYPLTLKTVDVSVLFSEQDNHVKLSLRSKGRIDVNAMASKYFNGGGHHNAAGGKYFGSLSEAVEFFEKVIKEEV